MAELKYQEGIRLLRQPVMPLVSMVQFIFMTGPFATVAEVIDEFPEPLETDQATYSNPQALLREYIDILAQYEQLKDGSMTETGIVDEQDNPVDPFAAMEALIGQQILTRELEHINSVLCAPCGCRLCCIGPDKNMAQEFFEIPLQEPELDLFAVPKHESQESLCRTPYDENELILEGRPFYDQDMAGLFHWQSGWSLILPKESQCPNLEASSGRCTVYGDRPVVCRRPQIFPYLLEHVDTGGTNETCYRIRQALLAVVDCPYVRELQEIIAEYASACGLQLILKENKG